MRNKPRHCLIPKSMLLEGSSGFHGFWALLAVYTEIFLEHAAIIPIAVLKACTDQSGRYDSFTCKGGALWWFYLQRWGAMQCRLGCIKFSQAKHFKPKIIFRVELKSQKGWHWRKSQQNHTMQFMVVMWIWVLQLLWNCIQLRKDMERL